MSEPTLPIRLWRVIRDWLSPIDGDRLLREAKRDMIDGQEVLLFPGSLNPRKVKAIREAWERLHQGGVEQKIEVIHER